MELHLGSPGLLRYQTSLHGTQPKIALTNCLIVRTGHRLIQLQQGLAFFDDISFAHHHLLHDPTRQMLDGFALGVDSDHAVAGHAFVQRRQCRPQQKTTKAHTQSPQPDACGPACVGWWLPAVTRGRHHRFFIGCHDEIQ